MGLLNEVIQKATELEELKQNTLNKIAEQCKKYKDKSIKYVSKKPSIFIINFKDLKDNWSPEFYDYYLQFGIILHILKHTNPDNLINKWENIKKDGVAKLTIPEEELKKFKAQRYNVLTKNFKNDWYRNHYAEIKFHPNVVSFMDKLLLE